MRSETWIVREPPRKLTDRILVQQRVPEIDWRLDLIIIRAMPGSGTKANLES